MKQQSTKLIQWGKTNKLTLKIEYIIFTTTWLISKIDKKSYKNINIYYNGYITIKKIDDYESIYSVNPLYLRINHTSGYIEEKIGNKYLVFDSVDENKEVFKRYGCVWDGIKNEIKAVNGSKE